MTHLQITSFIIALVSSRTLAVEWRYVLRPPCIWHDANIRKKNQNWFAPKQVTSWAQRETVNVSRHTDVLGGARHRNDTGEPGLDIGLHIVVKFCSLGLEGYFYWHFAEISLQKFQTSYLEVKAAQRFFSSCELRANRRTQKWQGQQRLELWLFTMWQNT